MNKLRWKLDSGKIAHAIDGCDENASAWVALCGKYVCGPTRLPSQVRCPVCRKLAQLQNRNYASL